jgi:hypothetical protein
LSKAVDPKLRLFKSIPQNSSPMLFCKAAPENCFRKLLLKIIPQKILN